MERHPLDFKQRRTPTRGTRRARNWQRLRVGKRIKDKTGAETDWVLLGEPFRPEDKAGTNAYVDVRCGRCDTVHVVRLGHIVAGRRSCRDCAAKVRRARRD